MIENSLNPFEFAVMGDPVACEDVNTNNAWGFGGMLGKVYTYACGVKRRIGTAYFRHLKPEKVDRFTTEAGRSLTKAEALRIAVAYNLLNQAV